jgi:hypothetical protein
MRALKILVAIACSCLAAPVSAAAEECAVGFTDARGEAQASPIKLDPAQKLDLATLPNGASGIMCRRPSIIPQPNDLRVLTELGLAFGIVDDARRSLWIYATAGRLQTRLDEGKLTATEEAQLDAWLIPAQARFERALAAKNDHAED